MTEVTYNQFRGLHKGTPQKKVSKLWKKYKDGKYKLPAVEEPTEVVEEVVEEPAKEEPKPKTRKEIKKEKKLEKAQKDKDQLLVIGELCDEYTKLQKKMKLYAPRLSDEEKQKVQDRLSDIAKETIPKAYTCSPTDSWKIWFGPTSKSLLINTTNAMAFQITREWWQKNYQNTIYVDRELLQSNELMDLEIMRYFRMGRFLPRTPVVGKECMLPQGVKDIQMRGGQGTN